MQKIDDFDWDYLYAKAEEYIKEFIPEAHVNHGTMTLHGANPIVDVSFSVILIIETDSKRLQNTISCPSPQSYPAA